MDRIHDAFLKSRVLEHFSVHRALFIVANPFKRWTAQSEWRIDRFGLGWNNAPFFRGRLGFAFGGATATATTATAALARASLFFLFGFHFNRDGLGFNFAQRFGAFVRGLDLLLAFDARQLDMFSSGARSGFMIALPGFVDDDPFELGLFVKEIRDVKERVALQADIHKSGLHSRQHAHHASFVNIADDPLVLFAAFDIELGDSFIFDDRDFLFATVNTNN